jgi:phosphoesterase RecJ-like protein
MVMIPKGITDLIRDASHVVLTTHIHPDGDALGSLLGLGDVLKGAGKEVFCYLEEEVSSLYSFLPTTHHISTDLEAALVVSKEAHAAGKKVLAIALDCGDAGRLGESGGKLLSISPFIVIDHHHGHREFGDYRWLEGDCSSTGEMLYELSLALDMQVSFEAAFCFYVALVTDTGSFRYESTSPRTLRIAADLVEKGVRPQEVAERVYDNYTLARLRLMEMVLATLVVEAKGQVALIRVTAEMLQQTGACADDLEGFINYPRSLGSVKVAGFIKEMKKGVVSVSLRAKGNVDVAAIAAGFGGGGHKNAAGFRFSDTSIDDVQDTVLEALHRAVV